MGSITIVGTGWDEGQLTLEAAKLLTGSAKVILHTRRCGCAAWLSEKNIEFTTLDSLYETCDDFDEHAQAAADAVQSAGEQADVVYGVPDVRDRSAQALVRAVGNSVRVLAGPPVDGALGAYARGEIRTVEASDWESIHVSSHENCLIRELDNRELAAEIKLRLMEVYPEESLIWLLNADALPIRIPLYELDRAQTYDHRTCALVPAVEEITALERYDFEHLNEIMRILCGPGGCPWDRAQTHSSLRTCMLEEAYEVIDAIDADDMDHLYDELGDVLLQVAIHTELARLHGEFSMMDVTTAICEKMIHRHTHIFGGDSAKDAQQVVELWNRNKMAERDQKTHAEALNSVTRTLPAMLRAVKVLKRSADVSLQDEDIKELEQRCARRLAGIDASDDAETVLGEALLDMAGLARLLNIDPEIALNRSVNRFIERFADMEQGMLERGEAFEHLNPETLRKYWDIVKL